MFKVGDKVRCIRTDGFFFIKAGEIFDVLEVVLGDNPKIKVQIKDANLSIEYPTHCFELVKEEPKPKFKVSDKVRCSINANGFSNIYTIKKIIMPVLKNNYTIQYE